MQHAIWDKIGEKEPITSVKIENVKETTNVVTNELVGLLALQENIPE